MSHGEIIAKKKEEAAALALAAEKAKADAMTGEGEDEEGAAKKKQRTDAGEDDDIDDEAEMMYAQAIQECSDEEDEAEEEAPPPPPPVIKKRAASSAPPTMKMPKIAKVAPTPERKRGVADAKLPVEAIVLPTWAKTKGIMTLSLSDEDMRKNLLFSVPKTLKKDAQKAKWKAEAIKMQPWIKTLEKVLSGDATAKITDQMFKSALTAAKKVNSKVDKKLDYETETDEQKVFSVRVAKLRSALEAARDLRTLALQAAKSSIDRHQLALAIGKVQTPFMELNKDLWVGLPEHWVQAGKCVLICFCARASRAHLDIQNQVEVTVKVKPRARVADLKRLSK